jgi:hypothetical protein
VFKQKISNMNKQLSTIGALIFLSINTISAQSNKAGGDADAHGCRASAGYTFSVIKNDCVRLFEQEVQLNEVHPEGESTTFSAVIFSKDTKKAEVFIPGSAAGVILSRQGKKGSYVWKKGEFSLSQKAKGYVLQKSGKAIFSSEAPTGS